MSYLGFTSINPTTGDLVKLVDWQISEVLVEAKDIFCTGCSHRGYEVVKVSEVPAGLEGTNPKLVYRNEDTIIINFDGQPSKIIKNGELIPNEEHIVAAQYWDTGRTVLTKNKFEWDGTTFPSPSYNAIIGFTVFGMLYFRDNRVYRASNTRRETRVDFIWKNSDIAVFDYDGYIHVVDKRTRVAFRGPLTCTVRLRFDQIKSSIDAVTVSPCLVKFYLANGKIAVLGNTLEILDSAEFFP